MSKTFNRIDKFHKTNNGKLTFGVIELLVAYLLVSRAIDTGSLWQYLAFLLLFIGGFNNLIRAAWPTRNVTNAKGKVKKQ